MKHGKLINWIDFNKNGIKDIFEDPTQPVEHRIADLLSQMTLEEKTCRTATLYGFGRVLKDQLPTPGWKTEVWKDGIANIDEHLNGVTNTPSANTPLSYPFSRHAEARSSPRRWTPRNRRISTRPSQKPAIPILSSPYSAKTKKR